MKSGKISPILWVALGVSLGLFGFFLILANPFGWKFPIPFLIKTSTNKQNSSLPKGLEQAPTPYLILPHGTQTYNVQGTNSKKSKITSITYNPLDPAKNTNQTITATVTSSEPIKTINLTEVTDDQTTTHSMKFISGSTTDGIWSSDFQITDTYEKIYYVSFEIITELGNKTVQLMPIR